MARRTKTATEPFVLAPSRLAVFVTLIRRSVVAAIDHDALTVAQAVAYSAIVALFPALIVAAAVVGLLPESLPLKLLLATVFERILPSNVSPLLETYFQTSHKNPQTASALLGAIVVSVTGAANVVATLMEGFRRAHELPLPPGSFWHRRGRSLALVPLSLVPMTLASVLVVFGHFFSRWLASEMPAALETPVFVIAMMLRWMVALGASIGIIAVIYHLGTDLSTHMREHIEPWLREPWMVLRKDWSWRASLPGATVATGLWFVTTLLFGLYVTRYANYSQVYGPLGAAIALMFWLYIIALSVLIGSEFNAQLRLPHRDPETAEVLWKLPTLKRRRTGKITD